MSLLILEYLLFQQGKKHRINELRVHHLESSDCYLSSVSWTYPVWYKRDKVSDLTNLAASEDVRECALGAWTHIDNPQLVWCSWFIDISSGSPESSYFKSFASSCTHKEWLLAHSCCSPYRPGMRELCRVLGLLRPGGWGNRIAILMIVCKGFTVPLTMCSGSF